MPGVHVKVAVPPPGELKTAPDGTPVAVIVKACPLSGSVAETLKLTACVTVVDCAAGTVMTGA